MNKTNYKQYNTEWSKLGYPKKPYYIGNCGCGEVAICNCIIELEKYANETPKTIQPYCKQYADPKGNGTYWSGIPAMMKHYGMTEVKEHATMDSLWKELAKGDRVAIYLMGNRPAGYHKVRWTTSAHFVCSVDYKYENKKHWVYVKDSNSTSTLRNGWIEYTANMRNDVSKVWSGKLEGERYTGGIKVDGDGGVATVKRMQEFFETEQDGIITGQNAANAVYRPSLTSVKNGTGGSACVRKMQKWLSLDQDGDWGKATSLALQKVLGVEQDGYFGKDSMKAWQRYLNTHDKPVYPTNWVEKANAWAKDIADSKYHYVVWNSKVDATKTCPICKGRKYDNYYGWNCIGFASAVWHHGGGLKNYCNCSTISNGIGEDMYNAKTDAEALAIAKKRLGLSELTVIRNKSGIPKAQWKAGDICLQFSGSTYKHMFYYMGNGKVADAGNYKSVASQIAVRDASGYSAKIIIRYTGK